MARTIERSAFGPAPVPELLTGTAFMAEAGADTFVIRDLPFTPAAWEDEDQQEHAGVLAHVLRADDVAIAVDGSLDETGAAVVTLHADCYHVPGRLSVAIYISDSAANVACVYACVGNVYRTVGGTELDSGTEVPDLTALQAAYNAAMAAAQDVEEALADLPNAVLYEAQSGKTDAEKAAARGNTGAAEADLVDALHGLMNYGFDTPWTAEELVTRQRTRYVIDGTPATSGIARVPLNKDAYYAFSSSWPSSLVIDHPITMTPGQKLRVQMHIISGTHSYNESWTDGPISVRWLWDGSATARGTSVATADGNYCDFAYNAEHPVVHPILYIPRGNAGAVYNNLVVEVVVYDISKGLHDLPEMPANATDGTYTLKMTVSGGVPSFAWVPDGASLLSAPPAGGSDDA